MVAQVPRLLRDIVEEAIAREPDMMLLDGGGDDLETLVRRSGADVAIVADEDRIDRGTRHRTVLVDHPDLKILVVADDGRTAQLLQLQRHLMTDVSPQALVRAIREAAGAR